MNHLISQIPKSTFWQARLLLSLLGSIISTLSQTEDTAHFFSLAVGWPSPVVCLPFLYKGYELNSYKLLARSKIGIFYVDRVATIAWNKGQVGT